MYTEKKQEPNDLKAGNLGSVNLICQMGNYIQLTPLMFTVKAKLYVCESTLIKVENTTKVISISSNGTQAENNICDATNKNTKTPNKSGSLSLYYSRVRSSRPLSKLAAAHL